MIYLSGVAEDAAERDRVIAHAQKVKFAKDGELYNFIHRWRVTEAGDGTHYRGSDGPYRQY